MNKSSEDKGRGSTFKDTQRVVGWVLVLVDTIKTLQVCIYMEKRDVKKNGNTNIKIQTFTR